MPDSLWVVTLAHDATAVVEHNINNKPKILEPLYVSLARFQIHSRIVSRNDFDE